MTLYDDQDLLPIFDESVEIRLCLL